MNKKQMALITIGHLSCDINHGALPATLPFFIAAYGFNYQTAAGIMFAFACLSSLIQPIFGYLADKYPRPWVVPLSIVLGGGGLAATGFVSDYWTIFAFVMVSGVGAALFHPEAARFANKASGDKKGTGLSIFSVGGNSGFVLGPIVAASSLEFFGLRGTAVFGVFGLTMAAILLYQLSTRQGHAKHALKNSAAMSKTASAENVKNATTHAADNVDEEIHGENCWFDFSKLTGIIITRSTVFVACNTFIPLYWIHQFGMETKSGALMLSLFCTVGVCFNILGGIMADRIGFLAIIRWSYVILFPAVLFFGVTTNPYIACALMVPMAMGLYASFSSMVVLGQKYLAKNIGFASGVTLGLATSMGGMMAPLLGWVADNYGLSGALQVLSGVVFVGLLFALVLSEPKTPSRAVVVEQK